MVRSLFYIYRKSCLAGREACKLWKERKSGMKQIEMIVRPEKIDEIKHMLDEMECGGMNVETIMGYGAQKGFTMEALMRRSKSPRSTSNPLPKVRVEVVVADAQVEPIVERATKICETSHTGDGKIFIHKIADAVRIRTGERGVAAL